jgi:hypothetical protein
MEEIQMKKWYTSKTFWFNILALVVAVASSFGFAEFVPDAEIVSIAAGIVAVINLVLRLWFTDTKLN